MSDLSPVELIAEALREIVQIPQQRQLAAEAIFAAIPSWSPEAQATLIGGEVMALANYGWHCVNRWTYVPSPAALTGDNP